MKSHESTRQRAESSQFKNHEDHIAGKGFTSMSLYDFVHKFIPMSQAMKIQDAKVAGDKEWKKLETIPAWDLEKSQGVRRRLFWKHKETKMKVHFASLMDIRHIKNAELEQKFQKSKGRVVLRGDIEKNDSGVCAVFRSGLVCVPDDCSKSNGCYCKITRL